MSKVVLYGIKNCDSVKKAQKWLAENDIAYQFHDFRQEGLSESLLTAWLKKVDVKTLVNTRSTTWKSFDDAAKDSALSGKACAVLLDNPTVIKRPVLAAGKHIEVGFNADRYKTLF